VFSCPATDPHDYLETRGLLNSREGIIEVPQNTLGTVTGPRLPVILEVPMKLSRIAVLLCLGTLSGCGGGGAGTNRLIGTWTYRLLRATGQPAQICPTSLTVGSATYSCGAADTVTYRQDGTFTDSNSGLSGNWTLVGSTLTVTVPGRGAAAFLIDINGNTQTQFYSTDQVTATLTRQ
jgi:hypothetical protein